MNPQHLPEFTGPRFHRRELRYTQAPALPVDQHWATPIDHTRPASRLEKFGRVLLALALGAIVLLAIISCGGDDLATKEADAQALQDAQAHAIELQREARAMAALMGSKQ